MGKLKERSLACIAAAALALSLIGVTSLTAFANQLAPGELEAQSTNPIVYDKVYGVMHGEYALMMKSVTYEIEYKGSMRTFDHSITDLVKADGNGPGTVQVHTSSIISESVDAPGEWTPLESRATGGEIEKGFMRVWDKTTGKLGVKALNGSDIVPCAYSSILLVDDDLVAVAINGSTVNADFYSSNGANIGSASFEASGAAGGMSAFAKRYGSYVSVTARSSSELNGVTMRKEGGRYVQVPEMTAIYDPNSSGNGREPGDGFVYKNTDGMLHYRSSGGADVKLESAAGVGSCNVRAGVIEVIFTASGSPNASGSSGNHYFSTTGNRLNIDSGNLRAALNDSYVIWEWEHANDGPYRVYDFSGRLKHSFDATEVYGLDGVHYGATTGDNGTYQVGVYNSNGSLAKSVATINISSGRLNTVSSPNDDGSYSIVGYWGSWNTSSPVFYDANFNQTDTDPRGGTAKRQLALADGTVVNAQVLSKQDADDRSSVK